MAESDSTGEWSGVDWSLPIAPDAKSLPEIDRLREGNRNAQENDTVTNPFTGKEEVVLIPGVPAKR